ncbi:MAG: hypothetical protein RL721_430 [Candidatus Eisenbacteria bacterium]
MRVRPKAVASSAVARTTGRTGAARVATSTATRKSTPARTSSRGTVRTATAARRESTTRTTVRAKRPRTTRTVAATSPPRARLRIEPLTLARWPDLERLFGARGACAGCWCMWMRRPLAEYRRGQGEGNRRALRELVARRPPGLLAYAGDEPVGWIAVAPREEYVRLANSRVLAPVEGDRVWSAPCFFVAAAHRGRGVTRALLAAAARWARAQGAAQLEGYPHPDSSRRQPAAFVFGGFESVFRDAGFHEIARRSPVRPILRRALRGRARTVSVTRRGSVRRG